MGLSGGWLAPTLNKLRNSAANKSEEFSLTLEECSWVASIHYTSGIFGSPLTAILLERTGHRPIFIAVALLNLFAWVAIFVTRSVVIIYIVRLSVGLAFSMFETASSIYISEHCSPKIRGRFSGIYNVCLYGGILTDTVLVSYFSYGRVALSNIGLTCIAILSIFLLREPVQYLLMKGKTETAEKTYYWLRNFRDIKMKEEFEEIKQTAIEYKIKISFSERFNSPEVYKSLRIVFIMNFLMYCTGFAALNAFVTMILSDSSHVTANEFTIILGGFQLFSCCISSFIMDKFNRRTLWQSACILSASSHAGTAILCHIHKSASIPFFEWLLFANVTIYFCVFGMLMQPLASAARGELLPQRIKSFGNCVGVQANAISGFASAKIFLLIAETYGVYVNFLFYSIVCLLILLYLYFDLPETRGDSLVTIQKSLKKNTFNDIVPPKCNKLLQS